MALLGCKRNIWALPAGPVVESQPCDTGDAGSILGQELVDPMPQERLAATPEKLQPESLCLQQGPHDTGGACEPHLTPSTAK